MFPDIVDDTFATLGLDGPASTSGITGAADPQIAEDGDQQITPFFLTDGADHLLSNSVIGASWFTLNTSQNAYAGDALRLLVMQITTTGSVSGTLNFNCSINSPLNPKRIQKQRQMQSKCLWLSTGRAHSVPTGP